MYLHINLLTNPTESNTQRFWAYIKLGSIINGISIIWYNSSYMFGTILYKLLAEIKHLLINCFKIMKFEGISSDELTDFVQDFVQTTNLKLLCSLSGTCLLFLLQYVWDSLICWKKYNLLIFTWFTYILMFSLLLLLHFSHCVLWPSSCICLV